MPDWFRQLVRYLRRPEQCVNCGRLVGDEGCRRASFEVFCCDRCAGAWDMYEHP